MSSWMVKKTSKKPAQMWVKVGYGAEQYMTVQTWAASANKKYVLGARGISWAMSPKGPFIALRAGKVCNDKNLTTQRASAPKSHPAAVKLNQASWLQLSWAGEFFRKTHTRNFKNIIGVAMIRKKL